MKRMLSKLPAMHGPFGLAIAAAIAIAASSCPALSQESLVIARDTEINSMDPHRAWTDAGQLYVASVYETLVTIGADNVSVVPSLAASWTSNADQSEYEFKLDANAVFSDGSAVEAKDVKWSFERLKNAKSGSSFLLDSIDDIEVLDEKSLRVRLNGPNSEFINLLTAPYTAIVNSDLAEENGALAGSESATLDESEAWFQSASAGSGAYMLSSYAPGEAIRLEANPNYYRKHGDFGTVIIKDTPSGISQAQALQNGSADLSMQIDADTAKQLVSDAITVESVPSYYFVYVALSPGAVGGEVLSKPVREAIASALDYDGIIQLTVGGEGHKIPVAIPNGFPGTEGLPPPERDIERAKQLLSEAGVPEGFTLKAEYPNVNVYGVEMSFLAQKVQQDLAKINITLELTPVEFSVWRAHISGDGIPLTFVYYGPDYFGTAQYVQYFAMIEGTAWWNRAGGARDNALTNPREAELLKEALSAPSDEQASIYHEIALEMIDDRIIIPVVNPNTVLAYKSDLTGLRMSPCCNLVINEIMKK